MRGSMRSSPASDIRLLAVGGFLAALVLGLGAGSASPADRPLAGLHPCADGPLIVLTGNEKGFIRPCGCSKPALGGVHRRATWLAKLREQDPGLQLVSLGDLIVRGGKQQRMKFETFLMSMDLMGYQAFAPGLGDFKLGVDYLTQMKDFASFPFVLHNAFKDGRRLFKESVRLGESPYVVTGLVPSSEDVVGLEVKDPATSMSAWLGTLDVAKDRPLVLFNGVRAGARKLADAVPAAWRDRVIIAFGGVFDSPFRIEGTPVPVISGGSMGRFLAYLRPVGTPLLSEFRLEEAIEGQEDVSMMLDGYRQSLADEKLVEDFPRRTIENVYVGDQACVECHEDECKVLDPTPHEHAWASIKVTNDHNDPECASCHVTGWGESTGFVTEEKTPHLVNVTCEACHGPGEEHVNVQTPTPNGKLGENYCLKCHDADNSPRFSFDTYWPKIAHPSKDGGK